MDNRRQLFDGQPHYVLQITHSPVTPDILRFRGREALSEPFRWDIEFTTPPGEIDPADVVMKYASLRMRSGKAVHGIITGLEWLTTSADQSHYRVILSSRLALLAYTRRSTIYQNLSVPDVVEQLLRQHDLEGADFDFRLERTYPPRELISQWDETDLQFLQRILAEVGIYWRTEMDPVRELDVVIFADSQLNYQFNVRLPYCEPAGLYDGAEESVWGLRSWHQVVSATVSTRDYNYRQARTPLDASVSVRNDAVTIGEQYHYAIPCREAGDDRHPAPETESGAFYARLHHERELNKSARIHLFSNASQLTPGQVLEPQGQAVPSLKEGVIITLTTFIASRDSRLHVSVWGLPYTERYCYRPPLIPRPEIHGTLPARIESREKHDPCAWLDTFGRYRVRLDFDRSDSEQGYASLWLRQAKPFAGENTGWHTPLTDGTEVAIAYSNGDIDLPYIAYALHDSAHPDPINRDSRSQNLFRTAADNELSMEDQRGKEHIKLSTEYGKTQLNSGHLVDALGKPRGKGIELRSDERGTLRAGKGLFISADAQAKARGGAFDMTAALQEIKRLERQLQQLAVAAEQARVLKAHIDSQIAMFEQRLKPLNAALMFSAPQGVAFTSGEHLQLAASENLAINAGGEISLGVMGNMTAQVGDQLGLFASEGQLSLKSAAGPVEMQAQNGKLQLYAGEKLSVSSTEDISFTGKKRITLIGGGSYMTLDQDKIEYGTQGIYLSRVKKTAKACARSMAMKMPYLPGTGMYDLALNFADGLTPIAKALYVIHFEGGSELAGELDEQGRALHKNVPFEAATVNYQLPPPEPENNWEPWQTLLEKITTKEG